MENWENKGCKECRQGILSGLWPPPREVAVSPGPIFLYLCDRCHSYWEINLREAHVISEKQARETFPQAFGGTEMMKEE